MSQCLTCDLDLLRRYDQPGPRYTSYPTAPQFGPHFKEEMLREYIRRSNEELIPRRLSLCVHVPYCSSPCLHCGCNRVITRHALQHEGSLHRRGHGIPLRVRREGKIMKRPLFLLVLLAAAVRADAPESIYQLDVTLTNQGGEQHHMDRHREIALQSSMLGSADPELIAALQRLH